MVTKIIFALLLTSCGIGGVIQDGTGIDIGGLTGAVFVCELPATNVELEFCWQNGDATELAASVSDACDDNVTCSPSTRVPGCLYACPGRTGCNALESCWCPELHVRCTPNSH